MKRSVWAATTLLAGCLGGGASTPPRYFALAAPDAIKRESGAAAIAVEELRVDEPYDDRRIVHRTSDYRLAYDEYDQWAAPPGVLVADYLRRAYQASGRFGMVLAEPGADTRAILGGRILAFEQVQRGPQRGIGRVALDLELRDAESGRILWTQRAEKEIVLTRPSPENLAAALSRALASIAAETAPAVEAAVD
jgi:ABC-type uncharacterized transport system auxiliary subunit